MSKDQEERTYPLSQLYFYLTEGCNLRCRHCWVAPKFQDQSHFYPVLSAKRFESIIEQGKSLGLSSVKLTGGEPLLHPAIDNILEYLKPQDIDLTIETNGVLCTTEIARKIRACKNPFVSVSLDGADAETHEWIRGVSGSFEAALEGIRNLVDAGIAPQIIMCIMKHNQDQVEPLVRLAETLGAESVKFNITQPTARGKKLHESRETLTID
ncbi:MAG: radical SAM protein, partial [Desulfobacterales bacterium]